MKSVYQKQLEAKYRLAERRKLTPEQQLAIIVKRCPSCVGSKEYHRLAALLPEKEVIVEKISKPVATEVPVKKRRKKVSKSKE